MNANLVNVETDTGFNGIRYADLGELLNYLETSFDVFVSSDRFSDLNIDDRICHVDFYRGIRQAVETIKMAQKA